MALTCPYIIWKISPFNSTKHCFTNSFEFLNFDWRWEYSVHTRRENEVTEEIVSIYLRRLTKPSACALHKFSTVVSIKDSAGEHHAVKVLNHEISPIVSWCVWQKSKSYILEHNVVENNGCVFSLALESTNPLEDLNFLSNDKNYDVQCLEELSRDFDKFLISSRYTDVILKCNNTEIKAHKDILCFRSKKLAEMIEKDDDLETPVENLKEINLPCMDPVIFRILLRFIYTSTLPKLTDKLARELYEVANEYCIESLKKKCAKFIIEHLCNFNALETLIFANEYNDDYLKWAVSSHIASDLNILHSDQWRKFSKENKKLTVDVFKIFTERVNARAYTEVPLV